ncbi:Uncharacterized protein dnm_031770 [Desulfonema magnum]|uniref:Uncharacterized protein n=1 Tax=Desulfonema magnum TaxID=45655 RepID=A0A975GNS0_9BACT|nr:Uncharacterized protein dnm_031770 [Desulfonema magnum]
MEIFFARTGKIQQIEKFPDCVRDCKETRLFSRTGTLPVRKKPGFSHVRRARSVTARKFFDLLKLAIFFEKL